MEQRVERVAEDGRSYRSEWSESRRTGGVVVRLESSSPTRCRRVEGRLDENALLQHEGRVVMQEREESRQPGG